MIETLDHLEQLLAGTALAGKPLAATHVDQAGRVGLFVELGQGDDPLDSWQIGRWLLERTGRWPVLLMSWGYGVLDDFTNPGYPRDVAGIMARAEEVAVTLSDVKRSRWAEMPWDAWLDPVERDHMIERELRDTKASLGRAPSSREAAAAEIDGKPVTTELEFGRWLLDWERKAAGGDEALVAHAGPGAYFEWFEPGDTYALCLLPDPRPWAVPAFVEFYGAEGYRDGSAALVNSLRKWHEDFGAEPVAHWGTMLQFIVNRPPLDVDTAWRLATEHDAVGNSTLLPLGVPVRRHALTLINRNRWFLHDRP